MAKIEIESLAHSYNGGKDMALFPMQFTWRNGGAYALLGPSGCGKTTLLNILSGLLLPSQGRILFDGEDVTHLPPQRRNMAQVFQFPVMYETMTVYDNLNFPLRNRGLPSGESKKRVHEVAMLLEIEGYLQEKAYLLSPHLKQIVSLGRGLVRKDVNAILFDEPLTVVDPEMKAFLRRKLKEIHRELNFTLIYVTHDQMEALTFADEVLVMNEGKILQQGTPQELFEKPSHPFVGHFIGGPGMNFLPAERDGDQLHKVLMGIRPRYVEIHPLSNPDQDLFTALIVDIENLGSTRIYTMKSVEKYHLGTIPSLFKANVPDEANTWKMGERVKVRFPREKIQLFPWSTEFQLLIKTGGDHE